MSERAARRGGWPRGRFLLLVARDFLGAFLASQLVVCGLGAAAAGADAMRSRGRPDGPPLLAGAVRALGGGVCVESSPSPFFFCREPAVFYYLCGLVFALALVGVTASLRWCCSDDSDDCLTTTVADCDGDSGSSNTEALSLPGEGESPEMEHPLLHAPLPPKKKGKRKGRRPPPPPPGEELGRNRGCCLLWTCDTTSQTGFNHRNDRGSVHTRQTAGGGCDNCEGCNCACSGSAVEVPCDCCQSGEGTVILLIGVVVLFATIGVFVALFWTLRFWRRSMQRHVHVLHKRVLASDYVVADLSLPGAPAPPLLCTPRLQPGGEEPRPTTGPDPGYPSPLYRPPLDSVGEAGAAPAQAVMQVEEAPSAPPLELMDEHSRHLVQWGLL